MIRILAMLDDNASADEKSAARSEYTDQALECPGLVSIDSKKPGLIRMAFMIASGCTSAIIKRLSKDPRVERISVEEI